MEFDLISALAPLVGECASRQDTTQPPSAQLRSVLRCWLPEPRDYPCAAILIAGENICTADVARTLIATTIALSAERLEFRNVTRRGATVPKSDSESAAFHGLIPKVETFATPCGETICEWPTSAPMEVQEYCRRLTDFDFGEAVPRCYAAGSCRIPTVLLRAGWTARWE